MNARLEVVEQHVVQLAAVGQKFRFFALQSQDFFEPRLEQRKLPQLERFGILMLRDRADLRRFFDQRSIEPPVFFVQPAQLAHVHFAGFVSRLHGQQILERRIEPPLMLQAGEERELSAAVLDSTFGHRSLFVPFEHRGARGQKRAVFAPADQLLVGLGHPKLLYHSCCRVALGARIRPNMLTPAEELGLGGMRLATRVRQALAKIGDVEMRGLIERITEEARENHLWYMRDGHSEAVRLVPRPITALPDQIAYVHSVSLALHAAMKRLPDLYLSDPRVRSILKLPFAEEEWVLDCWGPSQRDANPVFGRLDAVVDFTSSHWKDTLRFLEPNMSGIGGLHLVPTADAILSRVIVPELTSRDPSLRLERPHDIRDLLMQEVLDHLEAIGRSAKTVCFIEPKYAGDGPDEQSVLGEYLRKRYPLKILHADPSELHLRGGEVYYEDQAVDLGYRDYAVAEILDLAKEGVDVAPMRALLKQNRMMSSIAAEMDQKACWEVLTDPELTRQHFTAEERRVFRRHVLWTRILSARKTSLPDGETGDLLEYARSAREFLVLKPNRSYGGTGVVLGPAMTDGDWQSVLERVLKDEERWVLQQLTPLPVNEFPVILPDGRIDAEPFYTVMGFAPTHYGVSVLARVSQKQVVNVAQHGGICSLLIGPAAAAVRQPSGVGLGQVALAT